MFSFLGLTSKPKLTEATLHKYNINIITFNDITIDKRTTLAVTGSGTFYKGTYHSEAVSVKVINITKDASIINEFLFWDLYKHNKHFLQLQGACIHNNEAYLVFDFFAFSLENAIKQDLITISNRDSLVKQLLYIIATLQTDGKKLTDVRPGVFGITDTVVVKLLDFGILINSERLLNNDVIVNDRMRYQPPEYFNYQGDDMNYDLWSFGCMLIDLYTSDNRYKICMLDTLKQSELSKRIVDETYPFIPKDINPMVYTIIQRCLVVDYTKRIKVDELVANMNVYFNSDNASNTNVDDSKKKVFTDEEESRLNKCYTFTKEIDVYINDTLYDISNKYITNVDDLMESVVSYQEYSFKLLNNNFKLIKDSLQKVYNYNVALISYLKDKMTSKLMIMKQYYTYVQNELATTKKLSEDIRNGINSLNHFHNLDSYTKVIETYENSVEEIKTSVHRFSESSPYDKVSKLNTENTHLVNLYKSITTNDLSTMNQLAYLVLEHSSLMKNDAHVNEFAIAMGIDDDVLLTTVPSVQSKDNTTLTSSTRNVKMDELYVKAQDNSDIIVIYNVYERKVYQINFPHHQFNLKSYSFYDRKTHSVYISGGLKDSKDKYSYDSSFTQINIDYINSEYQFHMKTLPNMNSPHISHTMVKYNDSYLLLLGGSNTQSCEVYDVKRALWKALPMLPNFYANASACVFNGDVFVFSGCCEGKGDCVLKLKCNEGMLSEEEWKGLEWENVKYCVTDYGRIRRGMGVVPSGNKIYLFGGFDMGGEYDEVFMVSMKDVGFVKEIGKGVVGKVKEKLFGKSKEDNNNNNNNSNSSNDTDDEMMTLVKLRKYMPNKGSFSSNVVNVDNNVIVLVDGMNCVYEFNLDTKDFVYVS